MAYTKQNFINGNKLTAEQLNAMDEQIAQAENKVLEHNSDKTAHVDIRNAISQLSGYSEINLDTSSEDNSATLLEAINTAIAVGAPVRIPAGTYVFTRPIMLPNGVTVEIIGASDAFANSMNREQVGTEYHAKENGTTLVYRGEGAMFRHQSCVFKFKNLSLVSQDKNKQYLYNARLVGQTMVDSATKGKIYAENCLFAGWKTVAGDPYVTEELETALGGTLIKPETLEQCCIVASRCRFSFCGAALNMGVDSRFDDCSINKCYYGAAFYGSAGFSTLSNCRIEWCIYDGVVAEQSHDVLVTGCEFDRCGHAAVRYVSCTGSSIIGNTMRRNGADSSLSADAATRNIHLYVKGCSGGTICGNTTVRKNISDDGSSSTVRPVNAYNIQSSSGMVISGNDFTGCTTGTYNRYTDNVDCRAWGNLGLSDEPGQIVDYLPKNQGSANVGKILVVGTDGNLTLADMPQGEASGDVIGTLDESNNILLSGNLADGTYTLKYENENGTYTEVGSLVVGAIPEPEPVKTNFADVTSTDWVISGRISNSATNGISHDVSNSVVTNYIPIEKGDVIEVYNASFHISASALGRYAVYTGTTHDTRVYNDAFSNGNGYISWSGQQIEIVSDAVNYIRLTLAPDTDSSGIVINIKRNGEWL